MASVTKRRWKKPDGTTGETWVVRYDDPASGKRPCRSFTKKKDADAYRVKIESELSSRTHVATSATLTVARSADDYFAMRHQLVVDKRLAPGTHVKDVCYYDNHIRPSLGDQPLRDLTPEQVDRWIHDLKKTKAQRGGRLQQGTVKGLTIVLARIIDYAVRRKLLAINVVRQVSKWDEHRRYKRARIRTFTAAEGAKLLASLETRPKGLADYGHGLIRAAVYLGAFCGLRIGEIMALQWSHIDFDAREIRVRHSLDQLGNLRSTKTEAGIRDVPIPSILVAALRDWEASWRPNTGGFLFRGKMGVQIKSPNFHANYWHPALRAAGLDEFDAEGRRFHFHALRHLCSSMMIAGGIPLMDTAQLLGHASFDETLQTYAHAIVSTAKRHTYLDQMAITMRSGEAMSDAHKPHGLLTH